MKNHRAPVIYSFLGMVGGFLVLHPYAMLVYEFTNHKSPDLFLRPGHSFWDILSFGSPMLLMGIAFALFGGTIGLLSALIMDKRKKLLVAENENRNREAALDAVHGMMVTLSHYLLNSNMIIGGKVRRCRKDPVVSPDVLNCLAIIEEEGRKIDAVVKALRDVVEIRKADYLTSGLVTMIDISRDLEDLLKGKSANDVQSG